MEIKDLYNQIPSCFKTEAEKAGALLLASDFNKGIECGVVHFNKDITKTLTTVRDILQEIYTNRMIVLWDKYMEDKTIGVSYFGDDLKPISVSVAMPLDRKEFILEAVGIMINRFDGE